MALGKLITMDIGDFAEALQAVLEEATTEFNTEKGSSYKAPAVDEMDASQVISFIRQAYRQRLHTQTYQSDQRKQNKALANKLKDLGIDLDNMTTEEITKALNAKAAAKAANGSAEA